MAEIRVEGRRGMGVWPWAVGLLVLAVAIWAMATLLGHDDGDEVVDQMDTPAGEAPRAP